MSHKQTAGFTIIEVVLFLGVTGFLVLALMVGSQTAITQQRYRDSVSTIKAFLQEQYDQTRNVSNGRSGDEACSTSGVVAPPDSVPSPQPRGTSECLMLGRYVKVDAGGTVLTAQNVIGIRTATGPVAANDMVELSTNYNLIPAPIEQETKAIPWDAQLFRTESNTVYPLRLLIVRGPLTGMTMTFTSTETATGSFRDEMVKSTNMGQAQMCVQPAAGGVSSQIMGKRQAIRISAMASSSSAVELANETEGVCG